MRLAMAAVIVAFATACGPGMGSIGAMLSKAHGDGRVMVREVPKDMEASKAGLLPGDEVLSIDGHEVQQLSAQEIHEALTGPVGTIIEVTVLRSAQVVRLRIRRGALK